MNRFLLCFAAVIIVPGMSALNPVFGDFVFNEAVLGDFSDDDAAPTFLDLAPGNNNVIGQVGSFDFDFEDHVTITVESNETLDQWKITSPPSPTVKVSPIVAI